MSKTHDITVPTNNKEAAITDPHTETAGMTEFLADFAALNVNTSKSSSTPPSKYNTKKQRSYSAPDFIDDFSEEDESVQHQSFLIGQNVYNQILRILPSMIQAAVSEQDVTDKQNILPSAEKIKIDLKQVKSKQDELKRKLQGYSNKVDKWTNRVKLVEDSVEKLEKGGDPSQTQIILTEQLAEVQTLKTNLENCASM